MKKRLCIVVLVLAGLISMNSVYAASKSVILTTMDLKEPYEIIGIINYRTSSVSLNDLINGLKNEAKSIKADAVVGVHCLSYSDYLYAYGTAVKFEK